MTNDGGDTYFVVNSHIIEKCRSLNLSTGHCLVLSLIASLSKNKHQTCWATDPYLSGCAVGCTQRVGRIIQNLKNKKIVKQSKSGAARNLHVDESILHPPIKNQVGSTQKTKPFHYCVYTRALGLCKDLGLPTTCGMLLSVLISLSKNKQKVCWETNERLSEMVSATSRTTITSLKKLEAAGLIKRKGSTSLREVKVKKKLLKRCLALHEQDMTELPFTSMTPNS